ncbi:MAG: hypothetical protein ACXWP5_13225 [Bdellovibrionota bacterium]
MKISPLTGAVNYLNLVREKADHGGHHQQNPQQKQQNTQGEAEEEATPEKIQKAVESFQADSQSQASGLQADVVNNGPGLTVVLKDSSGKVLRQFSGDEFVKLRESTAADARGRGKILDQKL